MKSILIIIWNIKKQRYPLYSYAETLGVPIKFWYDLFENRGRKCSFALFNGSNIAEGRYSYTIFDIAPNDSLTVSGFYRINERVSTNSKQTGNDTLAIMEYAKISYKQLLFSPLLINFLIQKQFTIF